MLPMKSIYVLRRLSVFVTQLIPYCEWNPQPSDEKESKLSLDCVITEVLTR